MSESKWVYWECPRCGCYVSDEQYIKLTIYNCPICGRELWGFYKKDFCWRDKFTEQFIHVEVD